MIRARTSSLRLVSWVDRGDSAYGPSGLPVAVVGVDRLGADAEPAGLAADLVERDQAVVDVEGGVLDPLGRHRRRHLLELAGEPPLLGPVLLARASPGGSSSSRSRMKRKTRRLKSGLRAMARRTAISIVAAVGVVDALVGDVRAVDGEAGDHPRRACRRTLKVKSRERRLFCASRSSWWVSMCSSLESDTCMISNLLR